MTASPICLCIVLMKLNSTEVVAAVGISVKIALGIVGGTNSLLYEGQSKSNETFSITQVCNDW